MDNVPREVINAVKIRVWRIEVQAKKDADERPHLKLSGRPSGREYYTLVDWLNQITGYRWR